MLWEAIILGVIIGWLRKGRLKHLNRLTLPGWPLILAAVLIQAAVWVDFAASIHFLAAIYPLLYILSFVLLMLFFFIQGGQPGFVIIGLGILLNTLVIAANEGKMPVDSTLMPPPAAEELAAGELSPFHSAIDDDTRLELLGDRIPAPYDSRRLLSIGDLVLAAGAVILIQQNMVRKKPDRKWRK